jgi:hypothetical protein
MDIDILFCFHYAGGNAYTLGPTAGDVVFSIQPANQGPQASGLAQSASLPTSITSIPVDQFTKSDFDINNFAANRLKRDAIDGGVVPTAFASSGPFPDSTLNFSRL